ncbi:glutathione S-transferase [Aureococcus anophagefferens]|nr:glutathione S-transferase [Aureococcus anophagefferens]
MRTGGRGAAGRAGAGGGRAGGGPSNGSWPAPRQRRRRCARHGVFVLGWRPSYVAAFGATLLGEAPKDGEYVLELGPFKFRDDSSVLPAARPAKPVVIYEYESSPFCRKVREACCLFDLEVEYRPVPGARGGAFARELLETSGRMTVPYMVDPNAGDKGMLESDDIIEYLREAYDAALELWGYEASPFVKPVRESLCELTLPHVVVPCSRGSPNRDRMVKETGRFQVPYLKDPNTGVALFESAEIVRYLDEVYTK